MNDSFNDISQLHAWRCCCFKNHFLLLMFSIEPDDIGFGVSILDTLYFDTPDGLPGNDDAGQLSAWYVLATMGIYPVDPLAKEFQTHEPRVQYVVSGQVTKEIPPYFKRFSNDSIFVKTGDIPDRWIRDSTVQVWQQTFHWNTKRWPHF